MLVHLFQVYFFGVVPTSQKGPSGMRAGQHSPSRAAGTVNVSLERKINRDFNLSLCAFDASQKPDEASEGAGHGEEGPSAWVRGAPGHGLDPLEARRAGGGGAGELGRLPGGPAQGARLPGELPAPQEVRRLGTLRGEDASFVVFLFFSRFCLFVLFSPFFSIFCLCAWELEFAGAEWLMVLESGGTGGGKGGRQGIKRGQI